MIHLPLYTAALGAVLIVLQVALMMSAGIHRTKGQFVGIGDDQDLERKVRRHGNLAENAGLFVAVIALFEMLAGQTTYVATVCIAFLIVRLSHAIGFSSLAGSHGVDLNGARRAFAGMRVVGAMGTTLTALAVAGGILAALIAQS